ncbi:glycosyltransferase family 52 protein [Shewanella sp. Isolate13]|uniref:glycosyltransferase family 52 n=1 Tax=Shewanella sp. Isolate13 TaxID=2908531 RepID=UPI001EFD1762|nr:glycosyltransferase family 52 [Shewanella sp. Isolate13]MCG9731434.1 glycosyltransferase family 52 protein [Shewanella sp. Isolate13]
MNVLERVGVDSDSILVFENTYYSLFLYLLCDNHWKTRDYLIFGDRISNHGLERLSKYARVLSESHEYMPRPMPRFGKNPIAFFQKKLSQSKLFNRYSTCVGNVKDINNWLVKLNRVQVDDGTSTRNELSIGAKDRGSFDAVGKLLLLKEPQRISRTNQFLLAAEIDAQKEYKDKISYIDIFDLWSAKTSEEQTEILDVFGIDSESFNSIDSQFSILFTQPWSEDFNYTEDKKIQGYKKLIKELGISESNLVIKPHPREITDYKRFFPQSVILGASFPSELITMLNVRVERVISLNSTACSSFADFCNEVVYARAPEYFEFPKKLADRINNMKL